MVTKAFRGGIERGGGEREEGRGEEGQSNTLYCY